MKNLYDSLPSTAPVRAAAPESANPWPAIIALGSAALWMGLCYLGGAFTHRVPAFIGGGIFAVPALLWIGFNTPYLHNFLHVNFRGRNWAGEPDRKNVSLTWGAILWVAYMASMGFYSIAFFGKAPLFEALAFIPWLALLICGGARIIREFAR